MTPVVTLVLFGADAGVADEKSSACGFGCLQAAMAMRQVDGLEHAVEQLLQVSQIDDDLGEAKVPL
jgi:hypothetical protein